MNTFQFPLKAGLVAGLILIVYAAILYAFDVNIFHWAFSIVNGLLTFAILIVAAVMGTNRMRDINLDKKITYMQAWLGSIIVLLVAMWLSGLFSYVLNAWIDTDYMPRMVDRMIDSFESMGLGESDIDKILDRLDGQVNPTKSLISSLWMSPAIAVVLGAIIAAFIKKDKTNQVTI
jgi:heme A synthase